ncbi:MAG TPA: tripartite tricarboxylate transporter substrate binding protein [Quisquiliibacterium sp.]|nr:tripartite tricarboxylate transporter substrate binding protein [Quisquiliibacterium sp.]
MRFGRILGALGAALALDVTLALGGVGTAAHAQAQNFPNRPIRLVVPSVAGGILDTVARTIATKMSEEFGQQVIVDNRPGAGGVIGSDLVAKAPADGYTLVKLATSHAINPSIYSRLPYDTLRDFAPVTQTVNLNNLLVAHPSVPANTLRELIALAKARPRTITFGSAGNGQSNHLSGELLKSMAGIEITHVPYKGSAAALTDVVAGNVSMMFVDILSALPHVKAGRLKVIAATGLTRPQAAAEVPTLHESGLPGFNGNSWLGLAAPAGTPKEVVAKISSTVAKILQSPDVRESFLARGVEPVGSTPEQYGAFIEAEIPRWGQAARASGAKVD